MAVYVDNMMAPYRRMLMSHMIADTEEELHAMAETIGIQRKWYQGNHYDICKAKRALAIEHGAVELTQRELVQKIKEARSKAKGPHPDEVLI